MDSNNDNNRERDFPEKFLRQLISRLPGGDDAEKILGKVEEIYITELRERIDQHMKEAGELEQSRNEADVLIQSLLVELYSTLLEQALSDRSQFHK